jgi:phosphonate transport system substrate-binding protein
MSNNIISIFEKMDKKYKILIFILFAAFITIITFVFYFRITDISHIEINPKSSHENYSENINKKTVYIGVISRYPPHILYQGYQPMLDYLTACTNFKFELKLSGDYNGAVTNLINREVTAAFLGSYLYVQANNQYGIIPILKPLNENLEPFSRVALITKEGSGINKISDLKNKKLALPSKESFSANWIAKREFQKYGMSEKDLNSIKNFPHHQNVIYQVIKGNFDAGVVREYLLDNYKNSGLKVIAYSEPISTPPLVVMPQYDKEIVKEIVNALLMLNQKEKNREGITKNWDKEFIYGFIEAHDSDYNYIRQIYK